MIEFNNSSIAIKYHEDELDTLRYVSRPDMRITKELENNHIKPKKVIINDPATIIFWNDGTKTVVKCDPEDGFDKEKGILYATLKKLSTKKTYNDILRAIDSTQDPFVEGGDIL